MQETKKKTSLFDLTSRPVPQASLESDTYVTYAPVETHDDDAFLPILNCSTFITATVETHDDDGMLPLL